ncbi:MAG: bifunctional homocysteine S-methyltransferase/methylenetetrahydrofolate reductase [Eubacteriales bacterium]|nr:bifunctional homocysteine S-methyltransferase/methylenetetrahydrofolate reductase [Eubacteriales bacterium]
MRPARDLLEPGLVVADGAMGTYYAQIGPDEHGTCEEANLNRPDIIRSIHLRYREAGARLLRTNTFAAVSLTGPGQPDRLKHLITSGYELALDCAGPDMFVAADIGPAYALDNEQALAGNTLAVEAFLDLGADLFLFETFADPKEFLPLCRLIRQKTPGAVIACSFALSPDGLTRKGIRLEQLADQMEQDRDIDIWGLNCGIGPTHLARQVGRLSPDGKPMTLMPNSGYPRMENQRLVYGSEPDYFAREVAGLRQARVRILGGCCGTSPRHIAALSAALAQVQPTPRPIAFTAAPVPAAPSAPPATVLADRLARGQFTVGCELDPPRDSRVEPLLDAARELRTAGIDLITLADSPMARVKMDSAASAIRVYRETGLPVLPHLCCRDRNANALRASLLALHSEGIRQVLAVTGDAIPESDRGFVKPVFNLNSIGLLQLIGQMNRDPFAGDPILAAAAVDPGSPNHDAEYGRACRKQEAGAGLFLTQPVFEERSLELVGRMRGAGMKVLIGLMPLLNWRNAQFLSHEVPGIRIPETILGRFYPEQDKEEALETGLAVILDLARRFRTQADGFYLIPPFNRSALISRFLARLSAENIVGQKGVSHDFDR